MRKCLFCNGDMIEQRTTFTATVNNQEVVVKDVPTWICQQCGTKSYGDRAADLLEKAICQAK